MAAGVLHAQLRRGRHDRNRRRELRVLQAAAAALAGEEEGDLQRGVRERHRVGRQLARAAEGHEGRQPHRGGGGGGRARRAGRARAERRLQPWGPIGRGERVYTQGGDQSGEAR
eukprot:1030593-Prorocentrum_minimum.AAC.1